MARTAVEDPVEHHTTNIYAVMISTLLIKELYLSHIAHQLALFRS